MRNLKTEHLGTQKVNIAKLSKFWIGRTFLSRRRRAIILAGLETPAYPRLRYNIHNLLTKKDPWRKLAQHAIRVGKSTDVEEMLDKKGLEDVSSKNTNKISQK